MAILTSKGVETETWIANASLSGKRGYGVKHHSTDGECVIATAASVNIGVIYDLGAKDGAAATDISVATQGVVPAVAGAAIAVGKHVTTDSDGKFVEASSGENCTGYSDEAAAADGDFFQLRIAPHIAP